MFYSNRKPRTICDLGEESPLGLKAACGRLVYGPKRSPRIIPSRSPYNYNNDKYWIILECDHDLSGLYRWFHKKNGNELLVPAWGTHISISRGEEPKYFEKWGERNGEILWFLYRPVFNTNSKHVWMDVYSDQFCFIRDNLGLSVKDHANWKHFHLTIGKKFD